MRTISFITAALVLLLSGVMAADAKTRRASASGSSTKGKATASTRSTKKVASKSKSGKRAVARKSPPRQMEPTTERYMQIQQALADKGYYTGEVNGEWGPECVGALKAFQADQKLAVDGKLGALSLIALGLGPNRDALSQVVGKPELAQ